MSARGVRSVAGRSLSLETLERVAELRAAGQGRLEEAALTELGLTEREAAELAKALKIIRSGGQVDYVGATAVELIGPGESAGSYREIEVKGGKITTVRYR